VTASSSSQCPVNSPSQATPQKSQAMQKGVIVTEEMKVVPLADITTMTVEELKIDSEEFDPFRPLQRSAILDRLDMPQNATIEVLEDNPGSFNAGVWIIQDINTTGLVMKLVPHLRQKPSRASDSEKYMSLQRQCPHIVTEFSLSFPVKIFQLRGPRGNRCKDVIVMRRATGLQLTQHIYHKINGGQAAQLLHIFKELGSFLHTVHRAYKAMQHGDCQPSNVFYDELLGHFTLIDCADFGYGPYVAEGGENDVEHFTEGLKTLTRWYGEEMIADLERQFRNAYLDAKSSRPR